MNPTSFRDVSLLSDAGMPVAQPLGMNTILRVGQIFSLCCALLLATLPLSSEASTGCRVKEGAVGAAAVAGGLTAAVVGPFLTMAVGFSSEGAAGSALLAYANAFGVIGMWAPAVLGLGLGVGATIWGLSRLYRAATGSSCATP